MTATPRPTAERVHSFVQWFESLQAEDQEHLMGLVYKEKKIRDVVNSLASMAQDQRTEVFQRLGLPQDMLSRMPPPDPAAISDVEVEWEEWKAPGS
jgi:GMP synthase PP-ATPase subunit